MKTNFLIIALFICAASFSQDVISDLKAPSEIKAGESIEVTVNYTVSEKRGMRVFVQLNQDPWTSVASEAQRVNSDSNTATFNLTIPQDVEEGSNYKIVAVVAPVGKGWPDRLDEKIIKDVSISK